MPSKQLETHRTRSTPTTTVAHTGLRLLLLIHRSSEGTLPTLRARDGVHLPLAVALWFASYWHNLDLYLICMSHE